MVNLQDAEKKKNKTKTYLPNLILVKQWTEQLPELDQEKETPKKQKFRKMIKEKTISLILILMLLSNYSWFKLSWLTEHKLRCYIIKLKINLFPI